MLFTVVLVLDQHSFRDQEQWEVANKKQAGDGHQILREYACLIKCQGRTSSFSYLQMLAPARGCRNSRRVHLQSMKRTPGEAQKRMKGRLAREVAPSIVAVLLGAAAAVPAAATPVAPVCTRHWRGDTTTARPRGGDGEWRHGEQRALAVCRERAASSGQGCFPDGDGDKVERVLRERLFENELDTEAALQLGDVLHLVRGDADSAASYFEHVLEREPRNMHAMGSYVLVLLRERRDYVRAELILSKILARQPHNTRAIELRAWLELYVHRRLPAARELCERALRAPTRTQKSPSVSMAVLRMYASVLLRLGKPMCAAAVLEVVLLLDPDDTWTLLRLAQVLQDRDLGVAELLLLLLRRRVEQMEREKAGQVSELKTLGRREVGAKEEVETSDESEVAPSAAFFPARWVGGGDLGKRRSCAWKALYDVSPAQRVPVRWCANRAEAREHERRQGTGEGKVESDLCVGVPIEHEHCSIQSGQRGACQAVLLTALRSPDNRKNQRPVKTRNGYLMALHRQIRALLTLLGLIQLCLVVVSAATSE